ncbi:hypothetical protein D9M72_637660 [compost metagenome]
MPARNADVAADTLADLLDAALPDLVRQERIGDRGTRAADQVENAPTNLGDHRVRRRETADADDRLVRHPLHEIDYRLMAAFAGETRGGTVCRA